MHLWVNLSPQAYDFQPIPGLALTLDDALAGKPARKCPVPAARLSQIRTAGCIPRFIIAGLLTQIALGVNFAVLPLPDLRPWGADTAVEQFGRPWVGIPMTIDNKLTFG